LLQVSTLNELIKMGAKATIIDAHKAEVWGPTPLTGRRIKTLDLRAGATLILASLVARGKSTISNIELIDRGYEKIEVRLRKLGAKIVTLSDSNGFIYDEGGIDQKELNCVLELKNVKRGRIKECAQEFNCKYYDSKNPWGVKCDIAFPSATQNEISGEDAKTLVKNGCIAIGEGANMPTTPEGIKIFQDAKILYAPGKAANAGGVATSGLEMSQNSLRLSWTREEVDRRLHDIMIAIHEQCVKYGKEGKYINYVNGANIAGFVKVADAMIDQGLV